LDFNSNNSHKEQLILILHIILILVNCKSRMYKWFLRFIHIISTTGLNLPEDIKLQLDKLGLEFIKCRGQIYDTGANMIGQI